MLQQHVFDEYGKAKVGGMERESCYAGYFRKGVSTTHICIVSRVERYWPILTKPGFGIKKITIPGSRYIPVFQLTRFTVLKLQFYH